MNEFNTLLNELKMSKATFAKHSGIALSTIYAWKKPPTWAVAFLTLLAKVRGLSSEYA